MFRFIDFFTGLTVSLDAQQRVSVFTKHFPAMSGSPTGVTPATITLRINNADFTIDDNAQFLSGKVADGS